MKSLASLFVAVFCIINAVQCVLVPLFIVSSDRGIANLAAPIIVKGTSDEEVRVEIQSASDNSVISTFNIRTNTQGHFKVPPNTKEINLVATYVSDGSITYKNTVSFTVYQAVDSPDNDSQFKTKAHGSEEDVSHVTDGSGTRLTVAAAAANTAPAPAPAPPVTTAPVATAPANPTRSKFLKPKSFKKK